MFYLQTRIISDCENNKGVTNELQDGNVLLRSGKPYRQDVYKSDDMVVTQHRPDRGNDQCNLVQK